MRVSLVSTSDIEGGAARAAYRLHKGLRATGVDSYMLVQDKIGSDPCVLGPKRKIDKGLSSLRPTLDLLPLYLIGKADKRISPAWAPDRLHRRIDDINPDLINLHWFNKGYMQIGTVSKLPTPLVWTLHDMWPFTGGCHYDLGCGRYTERCGACPQLESRKELDLTRWIWRRKERAWHQAEFTIVCPSRWLAECARRSSLLAHHRIEVIPNGLDVARFKPSDRGQARNWLGLPTDKKLLLFSAVSAITNFHKGFPDFKQATGVLAEKGWGDNVEIVILGSSEQQQAFDLPFRTHFMGYLHDSLSLSLVYGAVDVFVVSSVQDNLPNTVMEALACGTPCAGFSVGGIPEMIDHQENGYLVEDRSVDELAFGIHWILEDPQRWGKLTRAARDKALRCFDQEQQARRYLQLFEELMEQRAC
jgi:glycosyltransferase involved in cell wall biosynthesis